MTLRDEYIGTHAVPLSEELVTLFSALGFAVVIRDPTTAEILASSTHAEVAHLAAKPGAVRIAAARIAGATVRVELLRVTTSSTPGAPRLTPRQAAVAALLATDLQNAEMGARLGISTHTVRRHLEAIYRRLGVRTRSAAVAALRRAARATPERADAE